jgi:hypothetical protein
MQATKKEESEAAMKQKIAIRREDSRTVKNTAKRETGVKAASAMAAGCAILLLCAGCGTTYQPAVQADNIQTYYTGGYTSGGSITPGGSITKIDHTANIFLQAGVSSGVLGEDVDEGPFTTAANGFLDLTLNQGTAIGTAWSDIETQGNWALEIPGVMGMVSLNQKGGTLEPFVSNQSCPSLPTAQTFQFVTFGAVNYSISGPSAYGSVDVATVGDLVNFTNLQQYVFPFKAAGTPLEVNPSPSAISGACGNSAYGQVVSVPYTSYILGTQTPLAVVDTLNINSGFLFEDAAPFTAAGAPESGAGLLGSNGAFGLAKPSSPIAISTFLAASYNGFIQANATAFGGSLSATSAACGALQTALSKLSTKPSANTIYGGDFPSNNPSATGNCDVAIDLGTQDPKNNGLFTGATVYMGAAYAGNTTGSLYSSPAVAIAGQVNGKNAIFVTQEVSPAVNSNMSSGIFLLQANQ